MRAVARWPRTPGVCALLIGVLSSAPALATGAPVSDLPAEPSPPPFSSEVVGLIDGGARLMDCMQPVLKRETPRGVSRKIHQAGRYSYLRSSLASVLGSAYVAAIPVEDSEEGVFGMLDQLIKNGPEGDAERQVMLRAKAAFIAMIEVARVTEPGCEPTGLADALARIPPEP